MKQLDNYLKQHNGINWQQILEHFLGMIAALGLVIVFVALMYFIFIILRGLI